MMFCRDLLVRCLILVTLYFYLPVSASSFKVCVVTVCSLNGGYLASEDAQLSLQYGVQTAAAYASKNGYPFFLSSIVPPGDEPFSKRLDWGRLYLVRSLQERFPDVCDWIFVLEGDVIITNHDFDLQSVFDIAGNASFILNRDAAGNLNTGVFFVRSNAMGRSIVDTIASIRFSHKSDPKVVTWASNGATMIAYRNQTIASNTALVPNKLINAYPADWASGDFIVHFAGRYPKAPGFHEFLARAPPRMWPGYFPSEK